MAVTLTAKGLKAIKRPGRYADAKTTGLNYHLRSTGTRAWTFRWTKNGQAREMGLGPASRDDDERTLPSSGSKTDPTEESKQPRRKREAGFTLAEARLLAAEARDVVLRGGDPIASRREASRAKAAASEQTFERVAELYIAAHEAGWRSRKHGSQWRSTLSTYAYPTFGTLPVSAIDTDLVMKVVKPLWAEKTETASRLRGRLEAVLDFATVQGWRSGENPSRWKGHLAHLLPARAKVAAVQHHAAVPWTDIGRVMAALATAGGMGALAVRFVCLTATRSGEVRGAQWGEIDLAENLWTVPATRMKGGRVHRIPLSGAARAILEDVRPSAAKPGDFVFPGGRVRRPLSDVALSKALHSAAGTKDATVHGLRSCFRDWSADATAFPREVAEAALAHVNSDRVEAAYRRGDALEQRRRLMALWAEHCALPTRPTGEVVPIRGSAE